MSKTFKGAYTLRVPKDQTEKEFFEIELKDLDEPIYKATMKMLQTDEMQAVRFLVKELAVSGDVDGFLANWRAVQAANPLLVDIIAPLKGELKKN